jgi:hypothetical protein
MYCRECEEWHTVDANDVEVMVNFEKEEVEYTGYCPNCGDMMEHETKLGVLL